MASMLLSFEPTRAMRNGRSAADRTSSGFRFAHRRGGSVSALARTYIDSTCPPSVCIRIGEENTGAASRSECSRIGAEKDRALTGSTAEDGAIAVARCRVAGTSLPDGFAQSMFNPMAFSPNVKGIWRIVSGCGMKLEVPAPQAGVWALTCAAQHPGRTMLAEFPAVQMPANAHPIIQTLKRQMEVGEGLQLDNGQPAECSTATRSMTPRSPPAKRRQLPVNRRPHERRIHRSIGARTCDSSPRSGLRKYSSDCLLAATSAREPVRGRDAPTSANCS